MLLVSGEGICDNPLMPDSQFQSHYGKAADNTTVLHKAGYSINHWDLSWDDTICWNINQGNKNIKLTCVNYKWKKSTVID